MDDFLATSFVSVPRSSPRMRRRAGWASIGAAALSCAVLGCADESPPRFLEGELAVETEGGRINVSWPAAQDDVELDAYVVYVDGQAAARLDSDTREYSLLGVPERTTCTLGVAAMDAAGNESLLLENTVIVPDRTPPAFPTEMPLMANGDEEEVTLRWPASTDAGAVRYVVFAGEDEIGTATSTTLTLPRAVVGSNPGEPSVVAIDDAGNRSPALRSRWVWNLGMALVPLSASIPSFDGSDALVAFIPSGLDDDSEFVRTMRESAEYATSEDGLGGLGDEAGGGLGTWIPEPGGGLGGLP